MANKTEIMVSRAYKQIAMLTLATSILWVLMAVYKAIEAKYPADVKPEILEKLTPTIDEDMVNAMSERVQMKEIVTNYSFPSPTPMAEKSGI